MQIKLSHVTVFTEDFYDIHMYLENVDILQYYKDIAEVTEECYLVVHAFSKNGNISNVSGTIYNKNGEIAEIILTDAMISDIIHWINGHQEEILSKINLEII